MDSNDVKEDAKNNSLPSKNENGTFSMKSLKFFAKHLSMPIAVIVVGFCGSNFALKNFNKASLLKEFKDDIISPENTPKFIIAHEALKPYFSSDEWDNLIVEISNSISPDIIGSLNLSGNEPNTFEVWGKKLGALNILLKYDRRVFTKENKLPIKVMPARIQAKKRSEQTTAEIANKTTYSTFEGLKSTLQNKNNNDMQFRNVLNNYKEVKSWLEEPENKDSEK
jgi:hypothetical protein